MENLDALLCSALDLIEENKIIVSDKPKLLKVLETKGKIFIDKYGIIMSDGMDISVYRYEIPLLSDFYFLVPGGKCEILASLKDESFLSEVRKKHGKYLHDLDRVMQLYMIIESFHAVGIAYYSGHLHILDHALDPGDEDFEPEDQAEEVTMLYPFSSKIINELFELGTHPRETPERTELRKEYERFVYFADVESKIGEAVTCLLALP